MKKAIIITSLLLILTGCSEAKSKSNVEPKEDISKCKQFFSSAKFESALEVCLKYAKNGNAEAQYFTGRIYLYIKHDQENGLLWLSKSAKQNNESGLLTLAGAYYVGTEVKQDYKKAYDIFIELANKDNVVAQTILSDMYFEGKGVQTDYDKALKFLTMAANHGYALAQFDLGSRYLNGSKVELDYPKAIKWITSAAEQGYAPAQIRLGIIYEDGIAIKKNRFTALHWLQKAADQGDKSAQAGIDIIKNKLD